MLAANGPAGRSPLNAVNLTGLMERTAGSPVRGGASLSLEMPRGGGTLGCILRDLNDATAIYALTYHHVVAPGGLSLSRRILLEVAPGCGEVLSFPAAGANERSRDAAVVRLEPGFKWLPAITDIGVAAL
jgi:hypothetical protein